MPVHLLDTDILIDFLRGREEARTLVEQFISATEVPYISVVTVAELLAGMRRGEEEATEGLLGLFLKIPVSESIARSAGVILRRYVKSHGLELGDAIIGATALATGAVLVTRNLKHYPFPEIELRSPY